MLYCIPRFLKLSLGAGGGFGESLLERSPINLTRSGAGLLVQASVYPVIVEFVTSALLVALVAGCLPARTYFRRPCIPFLLCRRRDNPAGSRYLILNIKELGPKSHIHHGFWDLIPESSVCGPSERKKTQTHK